MPHPLDPLTPHEVRQAAGALRTHLQNADLRFKVTDLFEPPKEEVLEYLHSPAEKVHIDRKVRVYYHKKPSQLLRKAVVNVSTAKVEHDGEIPDVQGPVDWVEFAQVEEACIEHPLVRAEVEKLKLPAGAKIVNDPWAYGTDDAKERRRLFQCYMYVVLNDDPEANHYSLPLPFAPVFDAHTLELVHFERLPQGEGKEIDTETQPWNRQKPVEYSERILGKEYFRKDLKPLVITQPEGPSFEAQGRCVSWQKWTFQLGWTIREGPVLNDIRYDGRSLFYRVSLSEMTVPYGDPRSPYHRKQAFDLGDSGFGLTSNTLALGCDCLGHIAYFDGIRVTGDGEPVRMPNVICMHEIDQGIGWKHTNVRNGHASIVRDRQLVIQSTATVANYEYIIAFVLDQAASLHIELKATGIVSTMPMRDGVHSEWGTTLAPGVLAVNHQHLFCVRIDPNIDNGPNSIEYDDCVPVRKEPELDPSGCAFRVKSTVIEQPGGYSIDLTKSRTFKMINPSSINAVSGKPAGYKLHAVPSQMMMMGPETFNLRRGLFASKPIWVTKYRDGELYAAGEFTNQSREDTGLAKSAFREESVANTDCVLWHSFGVTHVTRPEDFPVMPHEKMTVTLKPTSFFESNPSNDVPRSSQASNQSTLHEADEPVFGGDQARCHV